MGAEEIQQLLFRQKIEEINYASLVELVKEQREQIKKLKKHIKTLEKTIEELLGDTRSN